MERSKNNTPHPKIICKKENYFGQALKELREENGFTQQQVSDKLSITQAQWSSYEVGRSRPNIDVMILISQALGINPLELFNRSLSKSKYFKEMTLEELKRPITNETADSLEKELNETHVFETVH